MYGSRAYGSSPYGGIIQEKPLVVFRPASLGITVALSAPVIFTEEVTSHLAITASLKAPTIIAQNREIVVKINTVDISNQVDFSSLTVNNNLYSDPDTAFFEIIKSSKKTYVPSAGDEIEIQDTGTVIFAGLLVKISKETIGFIEKYSLEFKDWTEEIGNILVEQTYENDTVENIIADIFTDSNLSAYDGTTNVSDTTNVTRIVFDNISVVEALDQLAELSGKHWYVSPAKKIYFFGDADIQAPFDLTDTNGKYIYSSLKIDEDLTQIRNRVTVKGKGIAAVTVEDLTSQATYGIREYFDRDNDISASNEATQKANAILAAYRDPIKIVNFKTMTEGLFSGQQIDIDSVLRGIDETLNIETVVFQSEYHNRFFYSVKATSQRLGGIEDLFAKNATEQDTAPALGDQGSLQDIEFTAIDDETISWEAGSIIMSNGVTYSIIAKASQVLTASHVIYFDPATSTTELQISTSFADGIGSGKIPLAYAIKSAVATKGASIFPVSFGGKIQLDGGVHISDNSILTDNLAANAVTAEKMSVTELSAISADLGEVTAGTITGLLIRTSVPGAATGEGVSIEGGSSKYIKLYYNASLVGWIKGYTTEGSEVTYINIEAASGRKLKWKNSYVEIDGDFAPHADNDHVLGRSNLRWHEGWFEDIVVDDLVIEDSCSGCGYKEINLLSDELRNELLQRKATQVSDDEIQARIENQKIPKKNWDKKRGDIFAEIRKEKKIEFKKRNFTGFQRGDVLIWGEKGLEKCAKDACRCVVGIADRRGIPIVLGAEPIMVVGKVKRGQFLVASAEAGCARAWDRTNEGNEQTGTVIAMAMEDKDSKEKALIKAMIQKF